MLNGYRAAYCLVILLSLAFSASAAELSVVSGNATSSMWTALAPEFEKSSGHKLVFFKGAGTTAAVKQRIESGEPFDFAIIPSDLIEELVKSNRFTPDTVAPFANVGMAVAARAGISVPRITSVESFKSAMLHATAITYVPAGEVAIQLQKAANQLGLSDALKLKTKLGQTATQSINFIETGDAELFFSLSTVISSSPKLQLVGLFPSEFQRNLVLSSGISSNAKQPGAAKTLSEFLRSAPATEMIRKSGLETIGR